MQNPQFSNHRETNLQMHLHVQLNQAKCVPTPDVCMAWTSKFSAGLTAMISSACSLFASEVKIVAYDDRDHYNNGVELKVHGHIVNDKPLNVFA